MRVRIILCRIMVTHIVLNCILWFTLKLQCMAFLSFFFLLANDGILLPPLRLFKSYIYYLMKFTVNLHVYVIFDFNHCSLSFRVVLDTSFLCMHFELFFLYPTVFIVVHSCSYFNQQSCRSHSYYFFFSIASTLLFAFYKKKMEKKSSIQALWKKCRTISKYYVHISSYAHS